VKSLPADPIVLRMNDGEERRIPLSEVIQYSLEGPLPAERTSGAVASQQAAGGAQKG
jgi:hypothetical protein